MSGVRRNVREVPLEPQPTYIGRCCREWPLAFGYQSGRCGLCGERPTFLREDEQSHWPGAPRSDGA